MDRFEFRDQVSASLSSKGYTVNPGSSLIKIGFWGRKLPKWLQTKVLKKIDVPDLLVGSEDNFIGLNVYGTTILLTPVFMTCTVGTYFNIPMAICVPDDKIDTIPGSVMEMINRNNIKLSSGSTIAADLSDFN